MHLYVHVIPVCSVDVPAVSSYVSVLILAHFIIIDYCTAQKMKITKYQLELEI